MLNYCQDDLFLTQSSMSRLLTILYVKGTSDGEGIGRISEICNRAVNKEVPKTVYGDLFGILFFGFWLGLFIRHKQTALFTDHDFDFSRSPSGDLSAND